MDDLIVVISNKHAGFSIAFIEVLIALVWEKHLLPESKLFVDWRHFYSEEDSDGSLINHWDTCFDQPDGLTLSDLKDYRRHRWPHKTLPIIKGFNSEILKRGMKVAFDRYVNIKDSVLEVVDDFLNKNNLSDGNYASVHVRGTDKIAEVVRPVNEEYMKACDKLLETYDKLFIATDEVAILEAFKERYGDRLCYTDCVRSEGSDPVHRPIGDYLEKFGGNRILQEILVDILILTRSGSLVRNCSNVTMLVSYINPELPIINIGKKSQR